MPGLGERCLDDGGLYDRGGGGDEAGGRHCSVGKLIVLWEWFGWLVEAMERADGGDG